MKKKLKLAKAILIFVGIILSGCTPHRGRESGSSPDLNASIPMEIRPKFNDEAQRLFVQGEFHQKRGDIKEAISYYSQSLDIESSSRAHNNRGLLYAEMGEYEKALSDYNNAIILDPGSSMYYANRSEIWFALGENDNSLNDNNTSIKLDPNNDVAYCNRGFYYWQITNDYNAALSDFDMAIKINKYSPIYYLNRSSVYSLLGYSSDKSIDDLTFAIKLDPNYVKAYLKRGGTYAEEKNYEKALYDFSKVIELDDGKSILGILGLYYRANIFEKKGRIDDAINDVNNFLDKINRFNKNDMLKLSVAFNKNNFIDMNHDGYIMRARLYLKLKNFDKSFADIEKAFEWIPSSDKANRLKIEALRLKNAGRIILKKEKNNYVSLDEYYYSVSGEDYHNKGNYDQAIIEFTKAISLSPNFAIAYHNRGYTYYKMGKIEKAISDFNITIQENPDLAQAYINRGHAYRAKGDLGKSCLDYKKACEKGACIAHDWAIKYNQCKE